MFRRCLQKRHRLKPSGMKERRESMPTLFEQAISHIKAGDIEMGKQFLAEVLKQNPRDEKAWLWMTKCVTDTEQKRYCFDRVLKINPQNQHALEGLGWLNKSVSPSSQPAAKIVQQPIHQRKPQKKNSLIPLLAVIGLLGIVCICGIALLVFPAFVNSSVSSQQNNPVPVQKTRPNYAQMLETNGFTYSMSDNEGNPSYTSPCGAAAIVKPDNVGFIVDDLSSDRDCATADIGRIIGVMYPSEVFDCVVTTIALLDGFDQMLTRTAVGYKITVAVTEYEHTLVVIIFDPR